MKVGILNVQWLNNLGSVLLAFAVQKKLDEMGIENEIINYLPHEYDNHGEIVSAHPEEKISSAKKIENYNKFRKNHLRDCPINIFSNFLFFFINFYLYKVLILVLII